MTIRGATIQGGIGDVFNFALADMTFNVTGLKGYVTLLFRIPFWFMIGMAIAANLLQIMQHSRVFAIPRFADWLAACVAVALIALTIILAVSSGEATLGIGSLLGFVSAVIPVLCLAIPSTPEQAADPDSESADG